MAETRRTTILPPAAEALPDPQTIPPRDDESDEAAVRWNVHRLANASTGTEATGDDETSTWRPTAR